MPYKVVKRTGKRPWKIINKNTNRVVGSSTSRAKATASMRARYAAEGGYETGPKRRRTKSGRAYKKRTRRRKR